MGAQDFESQKNYNEDKKIRERSVEIWQKNLLCATRMAERSLLSWCDRCWTSFCRFSQSIDRRAENWYPQAQLEASEKKTAPYKEALISYLNQHSTTFACPIDIEGTPFQKEVWQALQEIPYGVTMTYQEISEKLGVHVRFEQLAQRLGKILY